jgi:rhamnose transport system permease protein
MALSAVTLGLTFKYGWSGLIGMRPDDPHGISIWLAAALAIVVGTVAGACNGIFVAKLRVHPLLVTLATLAAFRGIAQGISLGEPVSGFPDSFSNLGQGDFHGVPYAAFIFAAGALLAAVVLIKMPLGRYLYAIGHNETAARFSGIPVDRIKIMLYTLAGTTAGLAGVIFVSRRNTAKADVGMGIELDVITAVVLGGTSIFGGRGNMLGTVLGILLVHETRQFVSVHWGQSEYVSIVIGLLLIGSVLLNRLLTIRRRGN